MTGRLELPAQPRILVVALRRLGDVLLTTPLIRSLRKAWPDARIDVLVFGDTAAILANNPDIENVLINPQRASVLETLGLVARLWRRYDLAISTQAGDRPSFLAILAGRKRVGLSEPRLLGRVKSFLFSRDIQARSNLHRVDETLLLAGLIGIEPCAEIVAPRAASPSALQPKVPYAVLHAAPFFRYKQWHRDGWRNVGKHLSQNGLQIVATGGPGAQERAYLDDIWNGSGIDMQRLDGKLTWPELASLLSGARVYVGPDTSVTHLAAASGCPTVAVYGPTDPRRWGPWPEQGLDRPWDASGTIQRRGNVWLIQTPLPCMPCQREGCLRCVTSYSLCLDEMPAERVTGVLDEVLVSAAPDGAAQGGAVAKTPLLSH